MKNTIFIGLIKCGKYVDVSILCLETCSVYLYFFEDADSSFVSFHNYIMRIANKNDISNSIYSVLDGTVFSSHKLNDFLFKNFQKNILLQFNEELIFLMDEHIKYIWGKGLKNKAIPLVCISAFSYIAANFPKNILI